MSEPRLLRRPYQAFPVGSRVLIVGKEPTRPALVPAESAAALARCLGPATLAEHAETARRALKLSEAAGAGLAAGLRLLWDHGFFVPWPVGDAGETGAARLSTLAVLTRNRPEALARCLVSHLGHAARAGRTLELAVVDSSDSEEIRRANREVVVQAAAGRPIRVRYADPDAKRGFADRLAARSGVPADVIQLALMGASGFGHDAGANRNALLLGLAGQAFISSDDDVVCEVRRRHPAAAARRLRLTSRADPTEVQLFESLAAAQAAVPPEEVDLYDRHERLLGWRLPALLQAGTAEDLAADSVGPLLWDLVAEARGRVAVTSSGLLGDSGARYPAVHAWSKSGVIDQLLAADDDSYRRLLESRQLVRAVDCPTVTPGPFLMSTHLGLDARQPLPPFSPTFRGQDMVFAALLRLALADALTGHLPQTVLHVPVQPRRDSLAALWRPPGPPAFATLLTAALGWVGRQAAAPAGAPRLRAIGRGLRDLVRLDPAEVTYALRSQLAETSSRALSQQLARYAGHRTDDRRWVRDLRRLFDHRLAELQGPFAPAAEEIVRTGSANAAAETLALIDRFGELLELWPDLQRAAGELLEREQGLFAGIA